jgi:PAS domain S-box-containing protein
MESEAVNDVGGQHLLVVDDNPATCYATSRVLRAAGFTVREAGTGGEALARVDLHTAAVVLDVHLPDIDGFEVCRTLRARPGSARLPVIHLSAARVNDADKVRGLNAGADAYITHPADPALLVATIKALIRARSAEEGMRSSEARFRAIFNQAISGICLIDEAFTFVEVNPAMLAMLKRAPADVVGRRIMDFAPPSAFSAIEALRAGARAGLWRGEFSLLDGAGKPVSMEWNLSPHGEPGLVLAVAVDISERVAMAAQRELLLDQEQAARVSAERLGRSKDEFIAVLSHELRTPLNAILNWVHVLKKTNTPERLARALSSIERNARIQSRLVSDILDVSRMDLGKLQLQLDGVDVTDELHSAVAALDATIEEKQLEVTIEVEGLVAPFFADAARFQQIVWNLLTNAIKFSPSGGRIAVRCVETSEGLELTVQDNGRGIAPEFVPFLFERFTQSDSSSRRRHGGLGLGLSIVKHLVELHGGRVFAASAGLDLGATFTVQLPRLPPGDGVGETVTAFDAEVSSHDPLAGLHVVVVDDDDDAREMLALILKEHGAHVTCADGYESGLACLQSQTPDVLVSDIGMPGKDGYDLIREWRRVEGHSRHVPAIALTAFARAIDRDAALLAGFDDHCAKPLRPQVLVAAINALIDGHTKSAAFR